MTTPVSHGPCTASFPNQKRSAHSTRYGRHRRLIPSTTNANLSRTFSIQIRVSDAAREARSAISGRERERDRVELEMPSRWQQAWALSRHTDSKIILYRRVSFEEQTQHFDACVSPSLRFFLSCLRARQTQFQNMYPLRRKMLRRITEWFCIGNEPWKNTMQGMKLRPENAKSRYNCTHRSAKFASLQRRFALHFQCPPQNTCAFKMKTFSCKLMIQLPNTYPILDRWADYLKSFCQQMSPAFANEHWIVFLNRMPASAYENDFATFVV